MITFQDFPDLYHNCNSQYSNKTEFKLHSRNDGKDYRVSPDQGFSAFTALQRQGVPSRLLDENR